MNGIFSRLVSAVRKRSPENSEDEPQRPDNTQRYALLLLPIWAAVGLADYVWHRRTRIETTSGTEESVMHALMIAEMGPAVLAALFLEMNAGVLAFILGSYLAHEATSSWDIYFTVSRRLIPAGEQHTHSYLQGVPFCLASFVTCTHWDQFLALIGKGSEKPRFEIRFKKPAFPLKYLVPAVLVSGAVTALPHAEEVWRCWKAERQGLTGRDTPECTRELFGG